MPPLAIERTFPDGALMGDSHEGRVWRVFAPRWWELGRWWGWWTTRKIHGYIAISVRRTITRPGRGAGTVRHEVVRVRVIEADEVRLPNVPRPFES